MRVDFKQNLYLSNIRKKKQTVPGKIIRPTEEICDIPLNIALINCRSVKPKLKSLKECFITNKLSVALLNETWLYKLKKCFVT